MDSKTTNWLNRAMAKMKEIDEVLDNKEIWETMSVDLRVELTITRANLEFAIEDVLRRLPAGPAGLN